MEAFTIGRLERAATFCKWATWTLLPIFVRITIMRTALEQNPFAGKNQKVTFIMITVEYFKFVAKVTYHDQKWDLIQLSFHRLVDKKKILSWGPHLNRINLLEKTRRSLSSWSRLNIFNLLQKQLTISKREIWFSFLSIDYYWAHYWAELKKGPLTTHFGKLLKEIRRQGRRTFRALGKELQRKRGALLWELIIIA